MKDIRYLEKILWKFCDEKPENYEKVLADETPYPVDRETYDHTILTMQKYISKIRAPITEKKRLKYSLLK